MKNKRILIAITVLCLLVSFFPTSALASKSISDVIVSLQIDNPIMEVNGLQLEIDTGKGTKPIVVQGRTIVPIRAIIEAFGGNVSWNQETRTVSLSMENDSIKLIIGSKNAYLNGVKYTLDVAPVVLNGRTMLPIRFIAEGFNLGVAWESKTRTVSIIKNTFDDKEYQYIKSVVPNYSNSPYAVINNNVPLFKEYEIIGGSFEYYSKLDELGRPDVCMSSISTDIMPTGKRESINEVTPTGWINKQYSFISGGYLYNRCHLIGYQLTGENANKRNLITGTRFLNVDGMLPFENKIDNYIEKTGNHVMYRVTPVFTLNNLVADGVLLEAYSVEDNGQGICFCVYCYNTQPNIFIDYATGNNYQIGTSDIESTTKDTQSVSQKIYRTPSGKRYHYDRECAGKNGYEVTLNQAISSGLTPCKTCVH